MRWPPFIPRDHLTIRCPLIDIGLYASITQPMLVTAKSPRQHREAVFRIASYFHREIGTDFILFSPTDDRDYAAYLWLVYTSHRGKDRHMAFGACCFRRQSLDSGYNYVALQWAWIHPLMRGIGAMQSAWGMFRRDYGDFYVDLPLSRAMRRFMQKQAECRVLESQRIRIGQCPECGSMLKDKDSYVRCGSCSFSIGNGTIGDGFAIDRDSKFPRVWGISANPFFPDAPKSIHGSWPVQTQDTP